MNPGPTFDRVYFALKEQLTNGRFAPGDHLESAALGEELNASITPVRDALHRLVGERIVEAPRNDGFRVPAPTEAGLRDLYRWNRELLELACRRASGRVRRPSPAPERGGDPITALQPADLFRRIAALSGSVEHEAAVESLNDRLGVLRTCEERLFRDWHEELQRMTESFALGDLRALRREISAYHRRRQRCVPEILVEWRRLTSA